MAYESVSQDFSVVGLSSGGRGFEYRARTLFGANGMWELKISFAREKYREETLMPESTP